MIPRPEEQPVMSVEEAGRELGLGRSASYEAVRRGEIPSLRLGKRRVVPTAALRRLLGLDVDDAPVEAGASVTSISERQNEGRGSG
ncbi:MAG: helix-turn-helix domain-containing protein [Actinomycetota bacterium]|nr:helix-turn-helix domain-containing protein [Actinomycetota bacterium]